METKLHNLAVNRAPKALEVIFLHGLDGDAFKSWDCGSDTSLPALIMREFPQASIWSVGYRVRSSWWKGGSMSLPNRAINVLASIQGQLGNSDFPVLLVCHSYGGLLAKAMLRKGFEHDSIYGELVRRFRGLVFLATPHSGSSLATYADAMRPFNYFSPAIAELKSNNSQLRDLNSHFRQLYGNIGLSILIFYETMKYRGRIVVDEQSSDPGITGVVPIPIDANHVSICKPRSSDARIFGIIELVHSIISTPPTSPNQSIMARALAAQDRELAGLQAEARATLSANPGNIDAARAGAYIDGMLTIIQARPRLDDEPRAHVNQPQHSARFTKLSLAPLAAAIGGLAYGIIQALIAIMDALGN